MNFNIQELHELLNSLKNNHTTFIKIKSINFELVASKKIKNQYGYQVAPTTLNKIPTGNKKRSKNTNKTQDKQSILAKVGKKINNNHINKESSLYSTIISPMVGTFYRSPAPNEAVFVKPYEIVKKKQTVCIIEAMKLMNEIEAEVDGEIVEILVEDGDVVDCGQALMKVKTI